MRFIGLLLKVPDGAVGWRFLNNLGWLNDVYDVLPSILYGILAVLGGAGTVYAIVLGVNLAKSENDEKRRYAVYRLRNTLIGLACLIALVAFINFILPLILKRAFPNDWAYYTEDGKLLDNKTGKELGGSSNNNEGTTGQIGLIRTYLPFIKFVLTKF